MPNNGLFIERHKISCMKDGGDGCPWVVGWVTVLFKNGQKCMEAATSRSTEWILVFVDVHDTCRLDVIYLSTYCTFIFDVPFFLRRLVQQNICFHVTLYLLSICCSHFFYCPLAIGGQLSVSPSFLLQVIIQPLFQFFHLLPFHFAIAFRFLSNLINCNSIWYSIELVIDEEFVEKRAFSDLNLKLILGWMFEKQCEV